MRFDQTKLVQRWTALSVRERVLSAVGLGIVLISILYVLVYTPLQAENKRLQQQIQAQQDIHKHLQAVAQRVAVLRTQGMGDQPVVAVEPMRAMVDSSTQMGLAAALQIHPESADGIKVTVTQLAFDKLVYWLAALQRQHGLSVSALDLHQATQNGANVDGEVMIGSSN